MTQKLIFLCLQCGRRDPSADLMYYCALSHPHIEGLKPVSPRPDTPSRN